MKYHDISMPLSPDTPVYPGDPRVRITRVQRVEDGDAVNLSEITLGSHTGTHIDPPRHIFADGETVDNIPPDALIGPAVVVDAPGRIIDAALVESACAGRERVLFRTGAAKPETDFPRFSAEAATIIVSSGVRLVGVDALSVEGGDGLDAHKILLSAGVVILEGLDLSNIRPGEYELICLPLRLACGDGAPARAVLREAE